LYSRSEISLDALQLLTELYPQGLQCPNVNGQLPLHRALDQNPPHQEAVQMMLEAFPGAAKVRVAVVALCLPTWRRTVAKASAAAVSLLSAPLQCDMASYLTARHCVHQVADDEGYLPLHLALDCARPNPTIAKMLLDHYPESAFHKSKDGLLPIHCIISSLNPVIEVIELLLQIFPDSTESMAVDVIPGQWSLMHSLACCFPAFTGRFPCGVWVANSA
jgi:ankyrin repeat protein